jgi:hypothetical protein
MDAAASTRPLTAHFTQRDRKPGIAGRLLLTEPTEIGRTNLTAACVGVAKLTGASDSSKAVSGKSTRGMTDPPNTPASRKRTKI